MQISATPIILEIKVCLVVHLIRTIQDFFKKFHTTKQKLLHSKNEKIGLAVTVVMIRLLTDRKTLL